MQDHTIRITPNDKHSPVGKLGEAEIHFHAGPLAGCKLIGFSIWEGRSTKERHVTLPSRQYSVNGERRSFALLRPLTTLDGINQVRDLILAAYAEYERLDSAAARGTEIIDAPAVGIFVNVPGGATEKADPFF